MISWSNVWGTFKSQLEDKLLPKSGGTMTGSLILKGAPTADNEAASKKYVDDNVKYIEKTVSITNGSIGSIPNFDKDKHIVFIMKNDMLVQSMSVTINAWDILAINTKCPIRYNNFYYNSFSVELDANGTLTGYVIGNFSTGEKTTIQLLILPKTNITLQ